MFFSDVAGVASGLGFRPTVIEVQIGAALPLEFIDDLDSFDGEEWDTIQESLTIPAFVMQVSVQALSENRGLTQNLPASFSWITAGLSVTTQGGEGCTPGYWKHHHHFDSWTAPYTPSTLFGDVFENAFPGKTLLEVLKQGGGGLKALGRHTVAALLNAASGDVDYDLLVGAVISAFNDVFPGGDYETLKDHFEGFNEQGCPLN